jgi:excisionase family DNA binding protein
LDSTFTPPPASELGVSEQTLRRYITAGLIGYRQLPGGHYRIPRDAIEEFWSEHSPPPRHTGRRRSKSGDVRNGTRKPTATCGI